MGEVKYQIAHVIWYSDLADLIANLYDTRIDILSGIPTELIGQNTYHEFDVDGHSELDSFGDEEVVQHWINTGQFENINAEDIVIDYPDDYDWRYHWQPDYYQLEMKHMLHRLFKDGQIPAGKWIVTVYW